MPGQYNLPTPSKDPILESIHTLNTIFTTILEIRKHAGIKGVKLQSLVMVH